MCYFSPYHCTNLQQWAEATLVSLLNDLKSVKDKGQDLANYFCDDDDDNFLESVFLEIKHFLEEFQRTVKVS